MDETAIIEPIHSPDVYSPDLGQWLSRQPDHVRALAVGHYDRYAESIKAKDNTIDGHLQQLRSLSRFMYALNTIADTAKGAEANIHGLPNAMLQPLYWLEQPKNFDFIATQGILREATSLELAIADYSKAINEVRGHKLLTDDDKRTLQFKTVALTHSLEVAVRKLDRHIYALSEVMEEYTQNHSSNHKGATEYDRMSVMLAYYCADKVLPELFEAVDRLSVTLDKHMGSISELAKMDASVAILGKSALSANNASQRPAPVVEGEGAKIIQWGERGGAETKPKTGGNER